MTITSTSVLTTIYAQILIHEGPQSKSIRACIPAYKVKIPAGNAPQPA